VKQGELAHEPADFARSAGIERLAQIHKSIPIRAFHANNQLAVLPIQLGLAGLLDLLGRAIRHLRIV